MERTTDLTDQVAKESKDSTASDHKLHHVDTGAKEQQSTGKEGMKATVQHHHATPVSLSMTLHP